jgi:hypothetical protein
MIQRISVLVAILPREKGKKTSDVSGILLSVPFDATGFSYDVYPVDVRAIKPSTLYSPTL